MFSVSGFSQTPYDKGWSLLNDANVPDAIEQFNTALKDPGSREKSLLALTLLYSQLGQEEKASVMFNQFFAEASNPFPELYAMWFLGGVTGSSGKKKDYQLAMLNKLAVDARSKGTVDASTRYRLLTHHIMSLDKASAMRELKHIQNLDDWMMLGPFDNVVNSGFNKDFGVLKNPQEGAKFKAKYGGEITWFAPTLKSEDAYLFAGTHFLSANSIIYTQTFVESPSEQDVILNLGYSGSMKVWLNDSLIYSNPEHRSTVIDYYKFKCTLNKGYNRLLFQLGDYDENSPSFTARFTDVDYNVLKLKASNVSQSYQRVLKKATEIPFYAFDKIKKLAKDDMLYQVLLAKVYGRSNEHDKAEEILLAAYKKEPTNFFVLRALVLHYDNSNNSTNQNKYYEIFSDAFPNDMNVLDNEISKYVKEKNIEKTKEYVKKYNDRYPSEYDKISYELKIAGLTSDNKRALALYAKRYKKFPNDYTAMVSQYSIEKSHYSNPKKANKILVKYLKTNYSYDILSELANNYIAAGKTSKAYDLLYKNIELIPYSTAAVKKVVKLLSRQSRYTEAIALCKKIIESRPSDYSTLSDLATLYTFVDVKDQAMSYHKEALSYYPFSFETNEKIRVLQDKKKAVELIPEFEPADIIKEYEENFTPENKKSYDVVLDSKYLFIYKSKAVGRVTRYIIKMNDEDAISEWQKINLSASGNMNLIINDVDVIKKDGHTIQGEQTGDAVVFTNLELDDYIYVTYTETQVSGGKSSMFISDNYSLNSYSPTYKVQYNLLLEEGLSYVDTVTVSDLKPKVDTISGFTSYLWETNSPKEIKEETRPIPFSDIAQKVHITLDYSWKDIVQWYSDLSGFQAQPDYTIHKIVKELFDGKSLSDEDKFKAIYEFVLKNIQYSSIDFRQSNYIPQKASKTYHTRLGDCKDVSTLFVSIARAAGLEANLVLINTSNNGKKNVLLPSLNFNHCMVNISLGNQHKYLELTDQDLPFGYLYNYHDGASILEIPNDEIPNDISLTHLVKNKNYSNNIIRNTKVQIGKDLKMNISKENLKTGINAGGICSTYYPLDEKGRVDNLKSSISNDYKSLVTIDTTDFNQLVPREDSARYSYSYVVENDVVKLGALKTFKVPFTDVLVKMNIFEDTKREYDFNFMSYETCDKYKETILVKLDKSFSFSDIPKNVYKKYNGCAYSLKFKRINAYTLKIVRTYTSNRKNITPDQFLKFKAFMTKVNEAENTHLLFR